MAILIKTALSLITATVTGYLFLQLILPAEKRFFKLEYLFYSFVAGLSVVTLSMLFLSFFNIPFSLGNSLIAVLILNIFFIAILIFSKKSILFCPKETTNSEGGEKKGIIPFLEYLLLAVICAFVILSFLAALFYPMQGWDAMAHWGIKSKIFFVNGEVTYLNFDLHNEYPNYIPLAETWIYNFMGEVNDRLVMVIFPLFFLALLSAFYALQRRFGFSRLHSLAFTLLLILTDNAILRHSYIAYSDMALAFAYSVGFLMLLFWMKDKKLNECFILGAMLVGLSIWIKLEAVTLVFCALFLLGIFILREKGQWKYFFLSVFFILIFYIPWYAYCEVNGITVSARYNITFPDLETVKTVIYHFFFRCRESAVWISFFVLSVFSAGEIIKKKNVFIQFLVAAVYLNLGLIVFTYLANPEAYSTMTDSMHRLMMHISPLALFFVSYWFKEFSGGYKVK